MLGEGKDGYYDDQEYVDYYYYDRRRKREPYFYQRRKKRRQQMVGLVVIQGRNQVVSSVFQSDAAGNAAGFSAGFVQGGTGKISVVLVTFFLHKVIFRRRKKKGRGGCSWNVCFARPADSNLVLKVFPSKFLRTRLSEPQTCFILAPVVQRLDSATQKMNQYPLDK